MSLRDLQTAFMHAVFAQDHAGIAPYTEPLARGGLPVYRNNVYAALTKALQAIYPVVERLVDERFFGFAAHHYIDRYPSTSGDLNRYGAHFAAFLSEFPPAASLAYLPDVARLEWYCHQAHLAADDAPLDLQKLADVPPQHHGELRFRMNSAAHLLRSAWPIDAIWRVNQADYHGDQSVDLAEGGVSLLIQRSGHKILLHPLSAAEWRFLTGIAENQTLEKVFERVLLAEPGADAGALLRKFVAQATLVEFFL
jgi:hypothetical protein